MHSVLCRWFWNVLSLLSEILWNVHKKRGGLIASSHCKLLRRTLLDLITEAVQVQFATRI